MLYTYVYLFILGWATLKAEILLIVLVCMMLIYVLICSSILYIFIDLFICLNHTHELVRILA